MSVKSTCAAALVIAGALLAHVPAGLAEDQPPFADIIRKYAAEHGVPLRLAHAVIKIESRYDAKAVGAAGEIGLMQIKLGTARDMGFTGSRNALFTPENNIRFGMKYLAKAHRLGRGEICGTILKYNAGHGAKRMNPVSANYCRKVKRELGTA